jgi:hypothetical protein
MCSPHLGMHFVFNASTKDLLGELGDIEGVVPDAGVPRFR